MKLPTVANTSGCINYGIDFNPLQMVLATLSFQICFFQISGRRIWNKWRFSKNKRDGFGYELVADHQKEEVKNQHHAKTTRILIPHRSQVVGQPSKMRSARTFCIAGAPSATECTCNPPPRRKWNPTSSGRSRFHVDIHLDLATDIVITSLEAERQQMNDDDDDDDCLFIVTLFAAVLWYNSFRKRSRLTKSVILEPKLSQWARLYQFGNPSLTWPASLEKLSGTWKSSYLVYVTTKADESVAHPV